MKTKNFILSFFLLSVFLINAAAQQFPALLIRDENQKHRPLTIDEIAIDINVIGNLSITKMKMVFYNDMDRILEGDFYFPLGENQLVSSFALDANGKMRKGVVVEKEKGRKVFDSIVRRSIDPGLLEWTSGSHYKARVFPIPPKGYRTVEISYEQELKTIDKGFLYQLPLEFKQKIPMMKLSLF